MKKLLKTLKNKSLKSHLNINVLLLLSLLSSVYGYNIALNQWPLFWLYEIKSLIYIIQSQVEASLGGYFQTYVSNLIPILLQIYSA